MAASSREEGAVGEPAWVVSADEFSCIVRAASEAEARRAGGLELDGEPEGEGLDVRRAPEFDAGWTKRALILEHGWWFSCEECTSPVSESEVDEGADIDDADRVWCTECAPEAAAIVAGREAAWARRREAKLRARAEVERRWPGATVRRVSAHVDGVTVELTVPGCRWPVRWPVGQAHVWVPRGDIEAWRRFEAEVIRAACTWGDDGGAHHG